MATTSGFWRRSGKKEKSGGSSEAATGATSASRHVPSSQRGKALADWMICVKARRTTLPTCARSGLSVTSVPVKLARTRHSGARRCAGAAPGACCTAPGGGVTAFSSASKVARLVMMRRLMAL